MGSAARAEDPTFTAACWAASVGVLLGFGAMAVWLARKHARDQDLQVRGPFSVFLSRVASRSVGKGACM